MGLGNEVRGRKSEVGGRFCFQFSVFQLFSVFIATPTVVARFHGQALLQRGILASMSAKIDRASTGVLDECMIEFRPLTDGNVWWFWPMREGMRKWLTVRGSQIHNFPDVRRWDSSQSKVAGDGQVVPGRQA
jgi:hypothetical protein